MTALASDPRHRRSVGSIGSELRTLLDAGLPPLPGAGETPRRWADLARWGRRDLALARLAEGHADAIAILAEAGHAAEPGALYGVWAARPGGRGAHLQVESGTRRLTGTVRFCSGAQVVDRALVVAADADNQLWLAEVPVGPPGTRADTTSWATAAMADADTLDVDFDDVPVARLLGGPGWYTLRPGFVIGGGGVAAVWWGGAAGLLDRAVAHLSATPDAHQLAHLGELSALLEAADALLGRVAVEIDAHPTADHTLATARVRSMVEHLVRQTLDRVPRMLGAGPLSGDADLARMLADLGIFVRQHHGERDHAALGARILGAR